jgi:hypothetical protein
VPDLPGCVSGGETRAEYEAMIREAIELHLEGVSVLFGRKLALRGNNLFYEGIATSTRSVFRSEPHLRDRGFGVIQQADDTKPHVFAIGA